MTGAIAFQFASLPARMTPAFTKRVIKEYLTQLDPYNRFYLKSETDAILNKSDEELNTDRA